PTPNPPPTPSPGPGPTPAPSLPPGPPPLVDVATVSAIDRGLAYLVKRQNSDGSFTSGIGRKMNQSFLGHQGHDVAATALAGLAFLAAGRDAQANGAIAFVTSCVGPTGFITNDGSRMYEHAFALRFLAEVQAVSPSRERARAIERAVQCT